jgi:hypothetical protein
MSLNDESMQQLWAYGGDRKGEKKREWGLRRFNITLGNYYSWEEKGNKNASNR